MATNQAASLTADQDDEDSDGCLCGLDHSEDDDTPDAALPNASGGVEVAEPPPDEDDASERELDFSEEEQTPDNELPAAVGGL